MTKRFTAPTANPILKTIMEAGDFGILVLDADGRIVAWNAWLAERTAVPEAQALGKPLSDELTGAPQSTLDLVADVLATGRPRLFSPVLHKILIPFTKPSHQAGRISPIYDERERVSGVVLFINDVSPVLEYERFATSEAATERREREEIFQAIGHPTFILDKECNILAANRAAAAVTGCSAQELTGRKCYEIMHGAAAPPAGCPFVKLRTTGVMETAETEVETLNRVFNISCTPQFDDAGELSQCIHIAMDITERKQAEEALKLSEERYRAFVKQSSEAICLFEIDHYPIDTALSTDKQIDLLYAQAVIRECNLIFATSHGYDEPEEMLGFKIGQIFPRLAKENVAYLRAFIENCHHISDVETKEIARDGTVKYFLNSLIGYVEDGRLVRVWGAKQDISRIKQAEENILTLNLELERRVLERTAQLEAANRELEAFAYSVSHDLRAPLRAVDSYTQILVEDYAASLDDEGKRVCTVISESARSMGRLIDDLLAFSRIGRTEMRRSPVDMATLANSIFFELTTPKERGRIDFHIGPLPRTQGDPALLRQVWMNILGNAVKFSAKKERAVIEVGCLLEGSGQTTAVYFVRDNGAGFDRRYEKKLFGVFQRLHSSMEFEGTGVGLAIAQRIIQRHGGRIWAEGEVGKGAVFYFTLDKGV